MRGIGVVVAGAVGALALVGCAAPHQIRDRDDYLAEGTRVYPGETQERVIKAAETVLKMSDPRDWDFRYSLNGFTGLRRYVVYAVIATAAGQEKWDFTSDPGPNGIRASVSISEGGTVTGNYSSSPYEGGMASVPLYRLFWARVDYMLGKNPEWVSCTAAQEDLERNRTAPAALSGLCGITSDGREAEPPERLPLLARPVAAAPVVAAKKKR